LTEQVLYAAVIAPEQHLNIERSYYTTSIAHNRNAVILAVLPKIIHVKS